MRPMSVSGSGKIWAGKAHTTHKKQRETHFAPAAGPALTFMDFAGSRSVYGLVPGLRRMPA